MPTKIPTATMQIQDKVAGRLSPDLAELAAKDDTFAFWVDRKNKTLILDGGYVRGRTTSRLKMWGSNERARSGWIGLRSVMKDLGYENPDELVGQTFEAEVTGKKIEIHF